MKTCRVCGSTGDWDWTDDDLRRMDDFHRYYGNRPFWELQGDRVCWISELCEHCNHKYNAHYRRVTHRTVQNIVRDERILVEFIAHRLHILAQRHAAGMSITLCQAIVPKYKHARCANWWAVEIDGHRLCKQHAGPYERGSPIIFAVEDTTWLEQVMAFFHTNDEERKWA